MNNMEQYAPQIAMFLAAIALLVLGRNKILPAVGASKILLWLAFAVTIICGLMLGFATANLVGWLLNWSSGLAIAAASVVTIVSTLAGWHSVAMLAELIRDVADGTPDGDARRAALWVPITLPIGGKAIISLLESPGGLGATITGAIVAVITAIYCYKITASVLKASKGKKAWLYFAAAVHLLGGLVMIPALGFVSSQLGARIPGWVMTIVLTVVGTAGIALVFAAVVDVVKDKKPDQHVRNACLWAIPFLFIAGAAAFGVLTDGTTDAVTYLTRSVQ